MFVSLLSTEYIRNNLEKVEKDKARGWEGGMGQVSKV